MVFPAGPPGKHDESPLAGDPLAKFADPGLEKHPAGDGELFSAEGTPFQHISQRGKIENEISREKGVGGQPRYLPGKGTVPLPRYRPENARIFLGQEVKCPVPERRFQRIGNGDGTCSAPPAGGDPGHPDRKFHDGGHDHQPLVAGLFRNPVLQQRPLEASEKSLRLPVQRAVVGDPVVAPAAVEMRGNGVEGGLLGGAAAARDHDAKHRENDRRNKNTDPAFRRAHVCPSPSQRCSAI